MTLLTSSGALDSGQIQRVTMLTLQNKSDGYDKQIAYILVRIPSSTTGKE